MKQAYRKLFNEIDKQYIANGRDIFLYFFPHKVIETEKARLRLKVINGYPYGVIDEPLVDIYNSINKTQIENALSKPKYKRAWRVANEKFENRLGRYAKLNVIITAVFGPYHNPERSVHAYSAYTSLFFKISDVLDLIHGDRELFRTIDIVSDKKHNEYICLEDFLKIFELHNAEQEETTEATNEQEAQNQTDEKPLNEVDARLSEDIEATIKTDEYVKLNKAEIKNLMLIKEAEIEFSNNINIFLGQNDTGKTSLLKYLYAHAKSLEDFHTQDRTKYIEPFDVKLGRNLSFIFNTHISNIITKNKEKPEKLSSDITFLVFNDDAIMKTFIARDGTVELEYDELLSPEIPDLDIEDSFNSVFIPAKEILSIYKAVNTLKKYKDSFDDTYNELAEILGQSEERRLEVGFQKILTSIEKDIIYGEIHFDPEANKYVLRKNGYDYDMELASEGVKQVGMISTLIKKSEIRSGTILFIDEPDINMNPIAIRKLVSVLCEMANIGVQIFLSTHSYYILNWMEINARRNSDLEIKCFTLDIKDKDLEITSKNLQDGLPPNKIIEEADRIFESYLGL